MISDTDIEGKARELSLSPQEVEKDYVHGWVLKSLFERPALARLLVLKGGSALRKGYFADTRFTKDLDFSSIEGVDAAALEVELREVCAMVSTRTGVRFLDKAVVKDKNLRIPGVDALEARLYFKGFYNEENITLKTQLDITQFDRIYLPVQSRALIHAYPDAEQCRGTIRCQKAEEIIASKLTTLLHRRKAGDLFDLLYATLIAREPQLNRREVVTTFLRKSIFEPQPELARTALLAVPLVEYSDRWSSVLAPASALMQFGFVTANFAGLIGQLFDLVAAGAPGMMRPGSARGGGAPASRLGRGGASGGLGISIFGADIRGTIMAAGRSRTMVELTYDGYRRLVEPYKLEYYVRKRDGVGNEYFWGFDTSGGKSGTVGIKQFMCHKIESARGTSLSFAPRFAVEL